MTPTPGEIYAAVLLGGPMVAVWGGIIWLIIDLLHRL
jgi:hypothetical protein